MNVYDLKNQINKGNLEKIYLFTGSEIGEKNEIIDLLKSRFFQGEDPVIYHFYCTPDFDNAAFLDTLQSGLLFSQKKIVILKDIEQASQKTLKLLQDYILPEYFSEEKFNEQILPVFKKTRNDKLIKKFKKTNQGYQLTSCTKKDKKQLAELISKNESQTSHLETILILMTESNDKKLDALSSLLSQYQHFIFWEMFENKKIEWIREQFKKSNLYIDEDAIRFILDTIQNNKQQLSDEIAKITISFQELGKNEKAISRGFIEDYLYHSKEENAFTLFSALLNRNGQKALDILEKVFYTDEYALLSGLIWSMKRFIKVLDLQENQKLNQADIFKQLGIMGKKSQAEMAIGIKNYRFFEICFVFDQLAELDYSLRILPAELKLIKLQWFILSFLAGNSGKSFLQGDCQSLQL
ncbi:MAG: hypothetical protein MJB14_04570 [Spirochaetes bacterium]|nr:hypothetical protein [Spirochaetota bacterium]